MSFIRKCLAKVFATLAPFVDFRVLLLLGVCLTVRWHADPVATLGLASYLAFVIGMAAAALLLTKILMPYVTLADCVRSALQDGNIAAARVVQARVWLLLGILVVLMVWAK